MEKRFQVFISSTYTDLKEERQQVIQALMELDCMPAGMELFPAADDAKWDLIKTVIDDSDYYLVIIGGRYGSIDHSGISFTEREYDYAVQANKPVMGFVHREVDKIEFGKSEQDEELRKKLTSFKDKVEQRMCKQWTTPDELGGVVSRSYVQLLKSRPAVGWVRASDAPTEELLKEVDVLRQRVSELTQELSQSSFKAPPDSADLVQGEDTFSVQLTCQSYEDYSRRSKRYATNLSWNQIFRCFGALMLGGEADEREIQRTVAAFVHEVVKTKASDAIGTTSPDINNFEPIKTQLMALGYIQRGSQKRTASDKNRYWKLTPYGETQLMRLSAIRRQGALMPDAPSETSREERFTGELYSGRRESSRLP